MIDSTSSIYAPATSGRLVKAYADLYDLYRAVIPTLYSELISTVPSIGVQFSNDLLFLHRDSQDVLLKALSVGRASPGITSIEAAGAVRAGLEKLKLLSGRVLEEQIVSPQCLQMNLMPIVDPLIDVFVAGASTYSADGST